MTAVGRRDRGWRAISGRAADTRPGSVASSRQSVTDSSRPGFTLGIPTHRDPGDVEAVGWPDQRQPRGRRSMQLMLPDR